MLLEVVILLAGCLVLGFVFTRLGQSALIGYILAGMLLGGPASIKAINSAEHIEHIAELGVALLLFSLGLEFSWDRLKNFGWKALLNGIFQVSVTGAIASGISLAFGLGLPESIAIGAMVCLSSTAAVLRILTDQSETESAFGRNAISILLVQDLAIVPLAILITFLSGSGSLPEIAIELGKLSLLILGLATVLFIVVKLSVTKFLSKVFVEHNRELITLFAVVISFGATWGAHKIGLSPALGAFMAGIMLGGSAFAQQIRADISSLRIVLLTLFFGAVGMVADPIWIYNHWQLVLGTTVLIVFGKALVIWGILQVTGNPVGISLASGMCLAQIGEFAFVLGLSARNGDIISHDIYMLVVSTAIITLILTPFLITLAPRLAYLIEKKRKVKPTPETNSDEVVDIVIIGFGPAGQAIGQWLCCRTLKVKVVELNPKMIEKAEAHGFSTYVGDATHADVLEHVGIEHAKIIIITTPAFSSTQIIIRHLRRMATQAHIIARSRYQRYSDEILQAGADAVIGDEEQVGQKLSEQVLRDLQQMGLDK
ncbi:MAG: sodium:proton exchanger [Calditrichaeota bacterium]|nr:sodium:proton exchanger [Calditrichota bacterium]